jgi:hypothetical protein
MDGKQLSALPAAVHPYRDYWRRGSPIATWRGATGTARMAHPRYRNYFTPERNDLHNGFRSCAPY